MYYKQVEIKNGIKLHLIPTDKFKTNLVSILITTKLKREFVTLNSLIPLVLKRGNKILKTQEEINKQLEFMYGAELDYGVEKIGDNQVLKFYIESISDNFTLEKNEELSKKVIEMLFDIVFNLYIEQSEFSKTYVEQEKQNLKQILEQKKDNKAQYAITRCIEEMYAGEEYGVYKYGYVEDLEKIDTNKLYNQYKNLLNNSKIDIFVSGMFDEKIVEEIKCNKNIIKLAPRMSEYNEIKVQPKTSDKEKIVSESLEVTQGKLVIGLNLNIKEDEDKYKVMVYNVLLGGNANSKLFQNVREKASLAYTASSTYFRTKNNILIICGIEIENYEKTVKIIKEQLEDIKNGEFSAEELENIKRGIISSINTIKDNQDSELIYYFNNELCKNNIDYDEYKEKIRAVTKEDVEKVAENLTINTIYFLRN